MRDQLFLGDRSSVRLCALATWFARLTSALRRRSHKTSTFGGGGRRAGIAAGGVLMVEAESDGVRVVVMRCSRLHLGEERLLSSCRRIGRLLLTCCRASLLLILRRGLGVQ